MVYRQAEAGKGRTSDQMALHKRNVSMFRSHLTSVR